MKKTDDSRFFDAKKLADLSDGIFAFAMTFLIVTIDIPKTSAALLNTELFQMVPDLLTYALSFFLLAIFWMTNHVQMKDIKCADSRVVWINMLLFLAIVFVPFSTDLYSFYDGLIIPMLAFNLNIFVIGLIFLLQWHHLVANNLHHENFTKIEVRDRYSLFYMLMAVSLVAIGVGLVHPAFSAIVYILMFIYRLYLRKRWSQQKTPRR